MVKYLNGKSILDCDLKGDFNVESDCEGDLSGAKKETRGAEDGEEETRAVLITGSFAAYVCLTMAFLRINDEFFSWKSLFFYRCTDAISFAPLKSQGVDPRLGYIRENTVATAPPPCSPKSIYLLANLVRRFSTQHMHNIDTKKARNPAAL